MAEPTKLKSLAGGSLPELISPYMRELIEKTGGADGPIGKQFIWQEDDENNPSQEIDPQMEKDYEVAPGVIYKYRGELYPDGRVRYHGRVLWTISRFCATYCRFCFRGRMVGLPVTAQPTTRETLAHKPYLSSSEIGEVIAYITNHPEINEVILSGGDPLVAPQLYLKEIFSHLALLQEKGVVDIIRIHTRAPITNPSHLKDWHLKLFNQITNPHIVLHVNHPQELTPPVLTLIKQLQQEGNAFLFSQTVLLSGINDSVDTLYELFTRLAHIGVRPYYLHQNDPVYWARSFTVPMSQAVPLWQELRKRLSGIASTAKFVIDTPHGNGKVPVPEAPWSTNYDEFIDFKGKRHQIDPLL